MSRQTSGLSASVHKRLLNLARERNEDFQDYLRRFSLERLLYRLARSEYRQLFVLKGALLFSAWSDTPHRSTRDVDLLSFGQSSTTRLEKLFRHLVRTPVEDDGLDFVADSVRCRRIKADQQYPGVRVQLMAFLGKARLPIQVDIGFGDVMTPEPVEIEFPTLLDFPPPHLLTYSRETVVAEKFQAMVMLGLYNSRMRDFYDLWSLARTFDFPGELLTQAIQATFERRRTPLPAEPPLALSPTFFEDQTKRTQWSAFLRKSRLEPDDVNLEQVIRVLRDFLMPPTIAIAHHRPFKMSWSPCGPWQIASTDESNRESETNVNLKL